MLAPSGEGKSAGGEHKLSRAVLSVETRLIYVSSGSFRRPSKLDRRRETGFGFEGHARLHVQGLLQRAHIIAGRHRRIGKESDRRWEEGAQLESLSYVPMEFDPPGAEHKPTLLVRASESLIRKIKRIGIRELGRRRLGRRILEKICRRQHVNTDTLREYDQRIRGVIG